MEMNLTSRSLLLTLLMVVLLFSSPLVTLAQQISAEDQAKQDAENDVNKSAWFTAGCIGCAAGWTIIILGDETEDPLPRLLAGLGTIVPVLPIVYAASASPDPPAERLLGKSPEYLNVYVDSYVKEAKRQQVIFSAVGCGAGSIAAPIILLAIGAIDLQLY